jgi:hypothetical protein
MPVDNLDTTKSGDVPSRKNARKPPEQVNVFERAFVDNLKEHKPGCDSVKPTIEKPDAFDPPRITSCAKITDVLAECDLSSYIDVFLNEGFDDLETILDIRERDLEILNISIEHRRRLQRRLATILNWPTKIPLPSEVCTLGVRMGLNSKMTNSHEIVTDGLSAQ